MSTTATGIIGPSARILGAGSWEDENISDNQGTQQQQQQQQEEVDGGDEVKHQQQQADDAHGREQEKNDSEDEQEKQQQHDAEDKEKDDNHADQQQQQQQDEAQEQEEPVEQREGGDDVENNIHQQPADDDQGKEDEEKQQDDGANNDSSTPSSSSSHDVNMAALKPTTTTPTLGGRIVQRASVKNMINDLQDFIITFEQLTVHVPGNNENRNKCCGCSSNNNSNKDNPIAHFAVERLGMAISQTQPFYALQGVSGHVKTGEMVLVLAHDTQHSSTLLRALTGRLSQHDMQDNMTGTIALNGAPIATNSQQKWRRLAAHVDASDATHAAVLSVRETLAFAAACTWPSDTVAEKLQDVVQDVLECLDLQLVADTVVGDENVRGVSGGQKRRVTVGEMLLGSATRFLGLNSITDGLSSKDSLNLISTLAGACQCYKKAAVISLLQPSDEMVALFDHVLVLNEAAGLAYFGPPDRVLLNRVFLGHESNNGTTATQTMDEGSICDLVLRRYETPQQEAAVIQRFMASTAYTELQQTIASTRMAATSLQLPPATSFFPKEKYARTAYHQFQVIGQRRLLLIARNAVTYTRIGIAVVFGTIIGSLFGELQLDLTGSLSRTGYIFLHNFLVLMLSAAITIPSTFRERVTLYKHRSAEFYSSRVAYLTQVLLDIPLSMLEAILLSCISYWWVNLNPGVNNFFYFMGVLMCLECAGQALGRFLCAVSRTQVHANTSSSVSILIFGTVAGSMPGFDAIPTILRWLSWVTPASYGFEGMMINEFVGRNLSLVVLSDANSTTTNIGTLEGEQWLSIMSLPRSDWTSLQGLKGFDIIMILVLAVAFDLAGCYYVERNREWYFQQTRRPQRTAVSVGFQEKEKKSSKNGAVAGSSKPEEAASEDKNTWPTTLIAKDTCYYVPLKRAPAPKRLNMHALLEPCLVRCYGKKKGNGDKEGRPTSHQSKDSSELQLLTNVNARFARGRMTALMGTSGAGKTTLLDVIAGYKTGGRITGNILMDGIPKNPKIWKQISAYAEQNDILNPYMSVLETLRFTAACGLAGTAAHRASMIDKVVETMELQDWVDMIIGREKEGEGLPKHARKRVTIAVQLVLQPKILFLDEPTTGLGTTAANIVMQAIRRSTDTMGLITVATMHQPSKTIWDTFDDLLLLVKGGKVAYAGKMGENSKFVMDYFSRLSGSEPQEQVNPADFAIAAVTSVSADEAAAAFQASTAHSDLVAMIKDAEDHRAGGSNQQAHNSCAARRTNPFMEVMLLTKRHLVVQFRNPSYCLLRVVASCLVSLYLGLLFFGDKSDITGAVYTIGSLFFIVFVLVIPMQSSVVPLIEDRAVLYREATSGLYSRWSYGLGQLLADIPFHLLNTVVMFLSFYFLVGFRQDAGNIGYFILLLFASNWVIMSLGQLFALATPNEESANGLAGLSVILSVILMGFLIMVSAMPDGWVWAYWANLFHYIVQGFVTNELAGSNYFLLPPTPMEGLLNMSSAPLVDLLTNASTAFVFAPGTNMEPGSVAQQASNFVLLATQAAPGQNLRYDWNTSGIGALAALLECMVANECLVDPLLPNFITCCIFSFPRPPPCAEQFTAATETIDVEAMFQCFDHLTSSTVDEAFNETTSNAVRGVPVDFSMETFNSASELDQLRLILCLVGVLLPPALVTDIQRMLQGIFNSLYELIMVVVDIIETGISIPGELILWVFGWAEWQDGELSAPWKWYYCMFSVAIFLSGIEVLKLFAVRFIIWTKR